MADSSGLCMIKDTDTKIMSILLKLLPIPRSRLEGKKKVAGSFVVDDVARPRGTVEKKP